MYALNWKHLFEKEVHLCNCMNCAVALLLQVCIQGFAARDMVILHMAKEGKELCFSCSLSSKFIDTFYQAKNQKGVISS